jgi:hypothetical protein
MEFNHFTIEKKDGVITIGQCSQECDSDPEYQEIKLTVEQIDCFVDFLAQVVEKE